MSRKLSRFGLGLVLALSLAAGRSVMAQPPRGNDNQNAPQEIQPVKLTGPAAKKADDLIKGYTARIEKEIEQARKEVERLRTELHELIDVRSEMAATIAEVRGELAAKGTYSAEPIIVQAAEDQNTTQAQGQGPGNRFRRDLLYGLGSALPKDPSPEQRDQLRRLAPRAELKRMVDRLRAEVEETRTEVDQLAYQLLELRSGVPTSYPRFGGMGGGMGGMGGGMGPAMRARMAGMGGPYGPWFGSMGMPNVMGGGMGGMGPAMRARMAGMGGPYGPWFGSMGMPNVMGGGMGGMGGGMR
jgi:chorismate mutase